MKIIKDFHANNVKEESWPGAKVTIKYLTDDEIDTILTILEDCYPDGMTDTMRLWKERTIKMDLERAFAVVKAFEELSAFDAVATLGMCIDIAAAKK